MFPGQSSDSRINRVNSNGQQPYQQVPQFQQGQPYAPPPYSPVAQQHLPPRPPQNPYPPGTQQHRDFEIAMRMQQQEYQQPQRQYQPLPGQPYQPPPGQYQPPGQPYQAPGQYQPPGQPYQPPGQYQPPVQPYQAPGGQYQQMPMPQWRPPPQGYMQQHQHQISSLNGRKKALLIGINYFGTSSALNGCINDVQNVRNFLIQQWNWPSDQQTILVLTDDNPNPQFRPTRQNIIQAMNWLVHGAQAGDSLYFHFSGHGSEVPDNDGDEEDGMDSTICPEDYNRAGQILDDEMNAIMVRRLPPQVRLTAIFDCCHSGSALDLPYTYQVDGTIKTSKRGLARIGSLTKPLAMQAMRGNLMGAAMGAVSAITALTKPQKTQQQLEAEKGNSFADVIMFSGCKDSQTSADSSFNGQSAGAMTYAFLESMKMMNNRCSYGQLFNQIRVILQGKYQQKPQLSSARYLDMNQPFLV
ncbi:Metacaspase-1 [Gorgonomyces haynaldii]|nr:Metacaspase-1 [Gorgonomyces haynaldii]